MIISVTGEFDSEIDVYRITNMTFWGPYNSNYAQGANNKTYVKDGSPLHWNYSVKMHIKVELQLYGVPI